MPPHAKFRTIPGELAFIRSIRTQAAQAVRKSSSLRLGIGDDCAILRPAPKHEICVTTDFSLESRHFRRDLHPAQSAGHRCLARGLSDLAAMGADPLAVFLSLAMPAEIPAAWAQGFLSGLLSLARNHKIPLAGGDTSQSPASGSGAGLVLADIVALGQIPQDGALLRSGARPGDLLYVTGVLGGAAAELAMLLDRPARFRRLTKAAPGHPHLYPEPRLAVGRRLRGLASGAVDISDGLSTDLTHLCEESGVAAEIEAASLPIHPLARKAERQQLADSALELALHGGEDYELLFAAPPAARIPRRIAGTPIHRIGIVRRAGRKNRLLLRTLDDRALPLEPAGWEHFR